MIIVTLTNEPREKERDKIDRNQSQAWPVILNVCTSSNYNKVETPTDRSNFAVGEAEEYNLHTEFRGYFITNLTIKHNTFDAQWLWTAHIRFPYKSFTGQTSVVLTSSLLPFKNAFWWSPTTSYYLKMQQWKNCLHLQPMTPFAAWIILMQLMLSVISK